MESPVLRPHVYRFSSGQSALPTGDGQEQDEILLPSQPQALSPKRRSGGLDWQAWLPRTKWTITFISVAFIQSILVIGLEAAIFGLVAQITVNEPYHALLKGLLPALFVAVAFESIYQVVLGVSAARSKNTIQVFGICLNNICMVIFVALALDQVKRSATAFHGWARLRPLYG